MFVCINLNVSITAYFVYLTLYLLNTKSRMRTSLQLSDSINKLPLRCCCCVSVKSSLLTNNILLFPFLKVEHANKAHWLITKAALHSVQMPCWWLYYWSERANCRWIDMQTFQPISMLFSAALVTADKWPLVDNCLCPDCVSQRIGLIHSIHHQGSCFITVERHTHTYRQWHP